MYTSYSDRRDQTVGMEGRDMMGLCIPEPFRLMIPCLVECCPSCGCGVSLYNCVIFFVIAILTIKKDSSVKHILFWLKINGMVGLHSAV